MIQSVKPTVFVTGGPTREWIDPVRFLSNPSSGKMGLALAKAAYSFGYETKFIHGPIESHLLNNVPFESIAIESTSDMLEALTTHLCDYAVLIMAAAPADYTPFHRSDVKLKKGDADLQLQLTRTPDILKTISGLKQDGTYKSLFLVGFAAETHDTEEYALKKLAEKNLDMICLNDVSQSGAGFTVDTNIITLYKRDRSVVRFPQMTKDELAEKIFSEIEACL